MLIDRLQELDFELASKITDWCNLAEKNLEQIEKFFGQYTDHGPGHCKAMLASLDWLIPIETVEKPNPLEIALLILTVYHHDIGMAWDIERQDKLMKEDPDWLAKREQLIYKYRYSKTVTNKSEGTLLKLAFVEWARERHGEEARRWIEEHRIGRPEFRLESYFNHDPWPDIARLCEAHTEPTCADLPVAEVIGPGGVQINLCFLCCALRLADICHITIDRADPEVAKYKRFIDEYSREKWKVHQRIKGVGPGDRLIMINAKPDSSAVHRAIATIAREIKNELDKINMTLSRKQSKLTFPWINVDFDTQVEKSGLYQYRDWEFALDRSKVYELLMGNKLYADNSVCIRELLQNAVDAVYGRWGNEAAARGNIICRRYERLRDDQMFEVIEVEDNGIGMNEDIIENHLLTVPGEPFYKTGRFKREHPEAVSIKQTPIAQFGIGFLSNFMVAFTVEIFTRYDSPHKPAEPVHIELESFDKGVVYYQPDMKHFPEGVRLGPGTCVRLWLKAKLTDWVCSHRRGNWNSLEEVVGYWARKVSPKIRVEEFGQEVLILPKAVTTSTNALSIRDDAYDIRGHIDFSPSHSAPRASDIQVTVSGFYVENSPFRKDLLGFWFPKGEIDFSGNRDFSLTVDRRSFAEFEDSKAVRKAKELLAKVASRWIHAQSEWHGDNKGKLRKLLYWNFVFDEYEEIRKLVTELPLFRAGTGDVGMKDQSILQILEKEERVYLYLAIRPIFAGHILAGCVPAMRFRSWYSDIIDKLRRRYLILHGVQMGSVQIRNLNFRFNARARYRQVYPLHFLPKLSNARLEFTEEGWPLVRLVSLEGTAQTTGWDYFLNYEPNRKDWLICSSEGRGYWINPYAPGKPGIFEEGENIVGVFIKRKRRHLVTEIADGFLYPDDTVTIVVNIGDKRESREFTIAQLGDLIHPFDRVDFWIEQFCRESGLSEEDRRELLKVFYVSEYKTDPSWSSPPVVIWPEG